MGSSQSSAEIRREMSHLIERLFPIVRSITGDGVRATLQILREYIPLKIHEVPSGEQVFDWTVPLEWNINDAWIADTTGRRLVDFKRCNLHVVSYSIPVRRRMSFTELRPHLFTLPDHPDWIPYRTSYYREDWGFCLTHSQLEGLDPSAEYDVCIESRLAPGHLTYGECVVPGESGQEVLFSAHVCHPSLANDNLSAVVVATFLARSLSETRRLRHTYRFIFAPGTIGALVWLSRNTNRLAGIRYGLVLTCLGDPGPFCYKRSRRGDAEIDRVVSQILRQLGPENLIRDFSPDGYDERQYCSPGFDLPVGRLSRSCMADYPQYHSSADDLSAVSSHSLVGALSVLSQVVEVIEGNASYRNLKPMGEPHLGRRGLYPPTDGGGEGDRFAAALRWVLNLSDGRHSLLAIAERSGLPFRTVAEAARLLERHGLLERLDPGQEEKS